MKECSLDSEILQLDSPAGRQPATSVSMVTADQVRAAQTAFETWFKEEFCFALGAVDAEAAVRRMLEKALAAKSVGATALEVPEGYALVPLEPTPKMRQAGAQYAECGISANAVFAYRAMLDAAPPVRRSCRRETFQDLKAA